MDISQILANGVTDSNSLRQMSIDNANMAIQQSRMTMDEFLKNNRDLYTTVENKLKIRNIHKMIGSVYGSGLFVMGILEEDKYYQFTLNTDKLNQPEIILLHRRQTDSGHYIM